ncbi:MAG: hypothetical protein ACXAB7_12415 [Candidatus Kariarchaeaceae archaeon]
MSKRNPARVLTISEIHSAKIIKYGDRKIAMIGDEAVVKVRIYGTITRKFFTDRPNSKNPLVKKYLTLHLIDSTASIQVRCWQYGTEYNQPFTVLEKCETGEIIDIIGGIREYEGIFYITPHLVKRVDVNFELMRRMERLQQMNITMEYNGERLAIPL